MKFIALLAVLFMAQLVSAETAASLYDIPLKDINGKPTSLKAYKGKTILVVNVASKCGLTPQYTALEALHKKYSAKGFTVLGFPCNDFGAQEPGTNEEIKQFCSSKYEVTFPLFDKLHVKGAEQHPLYAALTGEKSPFPGEIKWNFGKFLISKDGKILKRFEPKTTPESAEVTEAVEAALAAK
ncbi:MAG: glutathione peroxidase [Verrucomicrobia bacterium]|nr:glutathione peroxidase [Verrucomicrobiota bacterium]